jgi:hypothetical protein
MTEVYTMTREDIEQDASKGWDLAIDRLENDGVITSEQAEEYRKYTVVMLTKRSVVQRFADLFKCEEVGKSVIRFHEVKIKN